jgi:aryl-alcohol dehydrogenase-like predicted oxidoreductase
MQYRKLGSSGLKVSAIGLGTNQFGGKVDTQTTQAIIDAAIDMGVNFIDTADVYQGGRSEEHIGKAIKGKRDKVLIATKFFHNTGEGPNERGGSRQHIMQAVEASLKRLDTDHIDLYQMHRWDVDTPIAETLRALDDLVTAGKVRYIGASNFAAWQLAHANAVAEAHGWNKFISIQPHYQMLVREVEKEIIPASAYLGIGVLPYFPLAGGFLTGKYKQGQPAPQGSRGEESGYVQQYMTPDHYATLEKLIAFAQDHGHAINELAHVWLLAQPQVSSVISGATKVEQVQANAKSAEWELSAAEVEAVNKILDGEE